MAKTARSRVEPSVEEPDSSSPIDQELAKPSHEQIAERAYHIYLERGGHAGDPVEDWLQAERELSAEQEGDDSDVEHGDGA